MSNPLGTVGKFLLKGALNTAKSVKPKTNGLKALQSVFRGSDEKVAQKLMKLDNLTKELSKMKITDLDLTTKSGRKMADKIRAAKSVRSSAREAELEWMQKNADMGKMLKSGAREFSSAEAKAGLNRARLEALKGANKLIPQNKLVKAGKNALKIGSTLGALGGIGYAVSSEPIQQYVSDLWRNNVARPYLGQGHRTLTNSDFEKSYLDDHNRIAQIAYRQYVREHGYLNPEEEFNLSINPSVYKEINESGRYAQFTPANIAKAAMRGDNQFEFTDGGMSGKAQINPKTGELEVTNTDKIAWEADNDELRERWSKGGLGGHVRLFMDKYGSTNENGDDIVLTTTIPADTIAGNYKGRLRDVPVYKKKK